MASKNRRNKIQKDDFFRPRIVYREIGLTMDACMIDEGWMINNKLYMISGEHLTHLLHYLNSKLFNCIILSSVNLTGGKGIDFMEKILVPRPEQCDLSFCSKEEVDNNLFDYYNLSTEECEYIDNQSII